MNRSLASDDSQRQWFIVNRWHELDIEIRACLVRLIAVAAFYAIELYNYAVLEAVGDEFHRIATALAVAWTAVSLVALLCVRRGFFPLWLKYATTIADVFLLTLILIAASGPRSPLIVAYFVIMTLAGMRFSLRLVWVVSAACIVSYLVVLAAFHPAWFGTQQRNLVVPRHEQCIILAGIALAGIILGQMARRVRAMANEFADRIGAKERAS